MILTAVAAFGGLVFVLASLIVVAGRWLAVHEDPRVRAVEAMLPHTNCGACGYPGCRAFAEALVAGETLPGNCTVSAPAAVERIAAYLGVDAGGRQRRVARLACGGGDNVARHRAHYVGEPTCAAAALVSGGGKACFWGCLGFGDCQRACHFQAIEMDPHRLPRVDEDRCTACGDCVEACPKELFSLQPIEHRVWVACASLAEGDDLLDQCAVACTGCGRCAADAPGQIEMKNQLPVIDYSGGPMTDQPTQRCPTGAIVWIEPPGRPRRGRSARPVVRHGSLPDSPT